MFETAIRQFEGLDPDIERRCLESFLLSLTVAVRYLFIKHREAETRLKILIQVNEINHHILNRVETLGGGDSFFTVAYTWHAVHEHARAVAALEEMVAALLNGTLNRLTGA